MNNMPSNTPKLLLCSSSPARKALIAKLNVPFEVASPDIDETPRPGESATDLVKRLAETKAMRLKKNYPNTLIIGCDQVIVLDGEILGKPRNHQDAVRTLQRASKNRMDSFTGMCVFNTDTQEKTTIVEPYQVFFRTLSNKMIEQYLQVDQPYQCAGSIKAEAFGVVLFEKMIGEDPNALTGLPLIQLTTILRSYGFWP